MRVLPCCGGFSDSPAFSRAIRLDMSFTPCDQGFNKFLVNLKLPRTIQTSHSSSQSSYTFNSHPEHLVLSTAVYFFQYAAPHIPSLLFPSYPNHLPSNVQLQEKHPSNSSIRPSLPSETLILCSAGYYIHAWTVWVQEEQQEH